MTTDTDTETPGCLHTTAQLGALLFGGAIGLYAFIVDLTISSQSLGHFLSPLTHIEVLFTLIFSPLTWVLAGGLLFCSLVAESLGGGK
jgi:hypothetical protein